MFTFASIALAAVSLSAGPVVRREILCWPIDVQSPKLLAELGQATSNGDGSWTLSLKPSVKLSDSLERLNRKGLRAKALAPRWSGEVQSQNEFKRLEAQFELARKDYEALSPSKRMPVRKSGDEEEEESPFESLQSKLEAVQPSIPQVEPDSLFAVSAPPVLPPMWTNMGPHNLQAYGTYGNGAPPLGGRVNDAAYDFFNDDVIYVASARGGVWKTTNGGAMWQPLSDTWPALNTSVVKTNPVLKNRVYVGTGDEPGGYGKSIGLMVSTDAGSTFTARGVNQFSNFQITDICVVPEDPTAIIVASGGGINELYRTPNEGQAWNIVIGDDAYWTDLDVSLPGTSGIRHYYAAGHRQNGCVLYKSDDQGVTWNPMNLPATTSADRIYISASKVNPEILYIHFTEQRRVFKNSGAGGAWQEITTNLATISNDEWGQNTYNNGLTCFLRNNGGVVTDALFIQNLDAYVTNGAAALGLAGGPWVEFAHGYSGNDRVHVDHHNVALNPRNLNEFLFCTDGGVARCKYDPATNTGDFEPLNRRLVTALVSRISISPDSIRGVLAGMQDNGMAWCANDPDNWLNLLAGDLGHSAINQTVPGFQYLMPPNFKGGLVETRDGWATRDSRPVDTTGDAMRSSPPIAIDPTNPRFVYVGTNFLYRYDSNNKTWESRLGNQLLDSNMGHVRHIAVAPSNSFRIYTVSSTGDVWTTTDGGVTWSEISTGATPLPDYKLSHVSVDPKNENRILVGAEEPSGTATLFSCTNTNAPVGTRVWSSVHGLPPNQLPFQQVLAIQRHPDAPSTCWVVGGDFGVYMTVNGGKNWTDLGANGALPKVAVTDVKIHPQGYIFAATYGRGVWRTSLPKVPVESDAH